MDRLLRINEITWQSIQRLLAKLDNYQARWVDRQDLNPDQLSELRELATVQSIGSSTRIEGAQLSDAAIAELIENLRIEKLATRDQQEVAGYYHTLRIVLESFADIPLSENIIKGLHKQLLQFSEKDAHHRGEYKTLSNQVVATLPGGEQRVIFPTTDPAEVREAMRRAVAWYHENIEKGAVHALVAIGTFVYEFLSIHPFQDGNGRLSRLLTTLLLLQNGYDFIQYTSLEQEIERHKADYYRSLMRAQRLRGESGEVIGSWLVYLLKAIERAAAKLDEDGIRLLEDSPSLYLNRRQQSVLRYFERHETLSIGEIDELLPQVSRNTLKYDLAKLTDAGLLRRRGRGRGTVYEKRS